MSTDPESMDPHAGFRTEGDETGGLRNRLESLLPNVLRKTVSTGVGARQMTEEVVRGAIGDLKLPKEAVTYLVDLADNTKKEVVRVAAREFREFLESARFNEEMARILTQLSFEIKTEIRFVPNDDRLRPRVESSAKVRNRTDEEATDVAASEGLNEALKAGAQDIAEQMLSRMFRQAGKGSADADATAAPGSAPTDASASTGATADAPEAPEAVATDAPAKKKPVKRAAKPKAASQARSGRRSTPKKPSADAS
jgi:hypothetical protein